MSTIDQFREVIQNCQRVFVGKMEDYGLSWRILRPSSLTDQIFIKASRIRSLEEKKTSKINEGVEPEYIGMINYSVMAITQMKFPYNENPNLSKENVLDIYITETNEALELMLNKNHDYDEAWRKMRISSLTDIILQKLLRIKHYSIFALIKLSEIK
jgi:hypothetical protein